MAKPLGPKTLAIRKAIHDHSDKGNTAIAELLNDSQDRLDDKLNFTANDVAAQKQAMKKGSVTPAPAAAPAAAAEKPGNGRKKPGRKPGRKAAAPAASSPASAPAAASPVDLIDKTLDLAQQAGGVGALKRLVDRIAEMQGR